MFSTQTSKVGEKSHWLSFDAGGNSEAVSDGEDGDATLEDAAERERDYVRQRLRDELQREPTEEELDEWLRKHTEGY